LSIIKEDSLVRGEKKEKRLSVLFDSGSARRSSGATSRRSLQLLGICQPDKSHGRRRPRGNVQVLLQLSGRGRGQRSGNPTPFGRRLARSLIFGASEMEAYMIKLDLARKKLDLSDFTGYMLAL
jgi:hypothetical protein